MIQSVQLSWSIIEELKKRHSAGVTELANTLNKSKSTIHAQLTTLRRCELVIQQESEYRLSLQFLDIAEEVKSQFGKYDVVTQEVDSLAKKTGEVVQFGTEEHGRLVYLYKCEAYSGVQTSSRIGKRDYLHSTSLGKAILSTYTQDRVDEIIDKQGLVKKTKNTLTSTEAVKNDLDQVRNQGFAYDNEENINGLCCMGVPVYADDKTVLGAISVSGPSSRITRKKVEEELFTAAVKTANIIQINYRFS